MFIVCAFIFLLAYYYFILRKYNTLGFRLFSLCFFVSVYTLYLFWDGWRELKMVEHNGIHTQARVEQKSKDGSNNVLEVSFQDHLGNTVKRIEPTGVSDEEFAELELNSSAPIIYSPESKTFFLEKSFQRQNHDFIWILILPGFFLVLGILCWIFLRRYRIHPHEGTTYEYMTDEDGKVVLDDAKNETTKSLHNANLLSKILQIFSR